MWLKLLFLFLFSILAFIICRQDLKERLVSLWLLILYFLTCIASVYFLQGAYALLLNGISTLVYFGLIFGVLTLYYFLREKKFNSLIDSRIGLADVILFLAIGLTLETVPLVLFFSATFLISALLGLFWFGKKEQTVPLAGILAPAYALYFFILWIVI